MFSLTLSRGARRRLAAPLLVLMLGTVGWVPAPCPTMEGHSGSVHGQTQGDGAENGQSHGGAGDVSPAHAHAEAQAPRHDGHRLERVARTAAPTGDAANAPTLAAVPDNNGQGAPVDCTMIGHCGAVLPALGAPLAPWAPAHDEADDGRRGWQLHAAPTTHLTPPPKA